MTRSQPNTQVATSPWNWSSITTGGHSYAPLSTNTSEAVNNASVSSQFPTLNQLRFQSPYPKDPGRSSALISSLDFHRARESTEKRTQPSLHTSTYIRNRHTSLSPPTKSTLTALWIFIFATYSDSTGFLKESSVIEDRSLHPDLLKHYMKNSVSTDS